MSRYAVIGNPVSHSKSPLIHSLFAQQTGEAVAYSAIAVEPQNLEAFIGEFFSQGGAGVNVTVPHKEAVFALAQSRCSPRAKRARAVNTLYQDSAGALWGDNTDGIGLVTDLQVNHRISLAGKRILLLGAGGAVRGALATLVDQSGVQLAVANRTLARAEQLRKDFSSLADLIVLEYAALNEPWDIIINGTSAGLAGETPPISPALVTSHTCCYDMLYGASDTPFVEWAKRCGAGLAVDGLGMLVEQAAESFRIWRGVKPLTRPVIDRLRTTL